MLAVSPFLHQADGDEFALAFARIECHYFVNGGFFRNNSQLLDDVEKIRHIPCTIVQGMECHVKSVAETSMSHALVFPRSIYSSMNIFL